MNKQETKIIRWGILGLGHIAHKFSQDLATVEGAELYAVASRSKEKATSFKFIAKGFSHKTAFLCCKQRIVCSL